MGMSPKEERRLKELETKIKRRLVKPRENIGPFLTSFAEAAIAVLADDDGCIRVWTGTEGEWEEYDILRNKKAREHMGRDINANTRALVKGSYN